MNVLIILAHPDTKSLNHAIAETCRKTLIKHGHHVVFHDLYKEYFNPVMVTEEIPKNAQTDDIIQKHCDDLISADAIIIIHPNWWGQPPAILKGWIDRVIRPGIAYKFEDGDDGEGVPTGMLKAQIALVFNTSNTSKEREDNVFKDPLETIWKNCIFDLCGVRKFDRKMFRIVVTSDLLERQKWLANVVQMLDKYFLFN